MVTKKFLITKVDCTFLYMVFFYLKAIQFLKKIGKRTNVSSHKNKFCLKVKNFSERAKGFQEPERSVMEWKDAHRVHTVSFG